MLDGYTNNISHELLLVTTRAVRTFVQQHDGNQLELLDKLIAHFESGDFNAAFASFKAIHLGPYGFGDWFPPVKFAREDGEYVKVVFDSLVERWTRLMSTAAGRPS